MGCQSAGVGRWVSTFNLCLKIKCITCKLRVTFYLADFLWT